MLSHPGEKITRDWIWTSDGIVAKVYHRAHSDHFEGTHFRKTWWQTKISKTCVSKYWKDICLMWTKSTRMCLNGPDPRWFGFWFGGWFIIAAKKHVKSGPKISFLIVWVHNIIVFVCVCVCVTFKENKTNKRIVRLWRRLCCLCLTFRIEKDKLT